MVSATPIVPSDPRFAEQGFEMLRIVPTYDYRQPLTVCITNNTVRVLRILLARFNKENEKPAFSELHRHDIEPYSDAQTARTVQSLL